MHRGSTSHNELGPPTNLPAGQSDGGKQSISLLPTEQGGCLHFTVVFQSSAKWEHLAWEAMLPFSNKTLTGACWPQKPGALCFKVGLTQVRFCSVDFHQTEATTSVALFFRFFPCSLVFPSL